MTKRNASAKAWKVAGLVAALLLTGAAFDAGRGAAASAAEVNRDATAALSNLYRYNPAAKALANKAVAVLIFPSIIKGGFIVAGEFGDGALRKGGKTVAYYRSLAASYGFQAGAQAYGYVLFFMDQASLKYLDKSEGW